MNKAFKLLLPVALLFAMVEVASAQTVTKLCVDGTNTYNGGNSCVPVTTTNPLPVTSSGSGTGNVNITQIGGNAISTGTGASGTGTQRIVTSSDSTIGVEGADGSTQASTTNPFPVVSAPSNAATVGIIPCVSQSVSTLQCGTGAPKNLYTAYLSATADSWLMIFNSTAAPTNGSTTAGTASGNLQDCVKVASGTSTSIGGLDLPERFSVGVYIAISSTACGTLTLATTGLLHGLVN